MTLQAQLPDELLDRLETLLDDAELSEAMRLDEIQGFLCAVLAGPQPMPEDDWLINALGSEEAMASDAGREAADLLRAFACALEEVLARGEPPVLLLYAQDDEEGPSNYLPWCQAYLHGIDTAADDWFDFLGADDDEENEEVTYLDERLFPLMVLTNEAETAALENGEAWATGDERQQLIDESEEDLPQAVADLYRFWLAKRGAKTIHRAAPKVGRNDPCPCGSGKKFKRCCGAS